MCSIQHLKCKCCVECNQVRLARKVTSAEFQLVMKQKNTVHQLSSLKFNICWFMWKVKNLVCFGFCFGVTYFRNGPIKSYLRISESSILKVEIKVAKTILIKPWFSSWLVIYGRNSTCHDRSVTFIFEVHLYMVLNETVRWLIKIFLSFHLSTESANCW